MTPGRPLVSVVTIFLDAARFLDETVASILGQTCDDLELLLVDDGSHDGSAAIARLWAEREPSRVRCLAHPGRANRGMSASRNLGLRAARGRYLALCDADDVWLPDKVARQVALLDAEPRAGMVWGRPEYWHGWTGRPADARRDHVPPLGAPPGRVVAPPELLLRLYPLGPGTAPCPSDLMFRREVFERTGGFEETFHGPYALYEDQAFLAKVYLDEGVLPVAETWTRYRRHPESCMAVVTGAGQYDAVRLFFLEWLERHLAGREAPLAVRRALEHALRPYRHPWRTRLAEGRRRLARALGRSRRPARIEFGSLRRLEPVSRRFGYDRGLPVDRHFIEAFLRRHAADVCGHVLEVGDDAYTRRFGGARVTRRDVLHVPPGTPQATFVADLATGDGLPSAAFDCVILTQTLHLIYDVRAALATLHRILRPGGTLLATFPGLSQLSCDEWRDTWYWGFTTRAARRLLAEAFPKAEIEVAAHGNVLTATAFLQGLAAEELRPAELAHDDPAFELLITARVVKPGGAA
jgi:glycosyltransferase involved in cell wall biosynthesis